MSLLLEALKRAEKAKEEAQRQQRGDSGAAELRIEEDAPTSAKPVTTRAELPDIKAPLQILSDDISPRETRPAPAPAAAPATGEAQVAQRVAARKVFEAKFRESDPRMPFFITLGVLGAFALGTVGYFWYQLRPPAPLVNVNATRSPAAEAQVATVALQTPPPPAAAPAQAIVTGLPSATPAPAAPAREPAASAPRPPPAQTPVRTPTPRIVRPAAPAPLAQLPTATVSSRPAPAPQIHPKVQTAYAAYLEGDLAAALADYQDALREQPVNRDALLGLAAIEVRTGRLESAEATYLRLLQLDPADAHAQAGLIALRAHRLDPLTTESRVKSMMAADPRAKVLHFTLGNQLAQQARWEEAQQEYFKAFTANPDNPDIAYNLAVSLDHLRQRKLALEYYQRAVALAQGRSASFSIAAARERAAVLEK